MTSKKKANNPIENNAIAIIGMGGQFPGASNVHQFWNNLCEGRESIRFFSDLELRLAGINESLINNPNYVKAAFMLENIDAFDAKFFNYSPAEATALDPQHRLMLQCAWHTLEDAGYAPLSYSGRVGTFIGSGGIVTSYFLEYLKAHPEVAGLTGSYQHLANDKDFLATRLSYKLNLTGPSLNCQTACSTSLVNVHLACQSLHNNECDMALAGGINIRVPQISGYLCQEGDVFSKNGHCQTFDSNAQGIVFGSGLGLVLLKPLSKALEDGDDIIAVIKGSAINNDGNDKVSFTASSASGQIKCMQQAFAATDITPQELAYIEAHGTGTIIGDPIEISSLKAVFGKQTPTKHYCAIGSVKTNVGHLDTAAGITSLIKTALILKEKKIPPLINLTSINPRLDLEHSPFYINTELKTLHRNQHPLRAAVNSLGMGGTNAFIILEEAPHKTAPKIIIPTKTDVAKTHLFTLSAKSNEQLKQLAQDYINYLDITKDSLSDICATANTGRTPFMHRIALVCDSLHTLKGQLKIALKDIDTLASSHNIPNKKLGIFLPELSQSQCLLSKSFFNEIKQILCIPTLPNHKLETLLFEPNNPCSHFLNQIVMLQLLEYYGLQPHVWITEKTGLITVAVLSGQLPLKDALKKLKNNEPQEINALCNKLSKDNPSIIYIEDIHNTNCVQEAIKKSNTKLILGIGKQLDQSLALNNAQINLKDFQQFLANCFTAGCHLDWTQHNKLHPFKHIHLPLYPFANTRFWIAKSHREANVLQQQTDDNKTTITLNINTTEFPYLNDHKLFFSPILAASALINWILMYAQQKRAGQVYHIDHVSFIKAIQVPSTNPNLITFTYTDIPADSQQYHDTIEKSISITSNNAGAPIEHLKGTLKINNNHAEKYASISQIIGRCSRQEAASEFYQRAAKRELQLTDSYQMVTSVYYGDNEALAAVPTAQLNDQQHFFRGMTPGLWDSLFQLLHTQIQTKKTAEDDVFLLAGWNELTCYHSQQPIAWVYIKSLQSTSPETVRADVAFLTAKGQILVEVTGAEIRRIDKAIATNIANPQFSYLHQLHWEHRELEHVDLNSTATPGHWIILSDEAGLGSALKQQLIRDGQTVSSITQHPTQHADYTIDIPTNSNLFVTIAQTINDHNKPIKGVIFLWPLDSTLPDKNNLTNLMRDHETLCAALLHTAQHLASSNCPIWIVTQGGVALGHKAQPLKLAHGTLWGFARTIAMERREAPCRIIDIDPITKQYSSIAESLWREISSNSMEDQIMYRAGQRYIARLHSYIPANKSETLRIDRHQTYQLNLDSAGQITSQPQILNKPLAGDQIEVAIEVSGLNFRDVMTVRNAPQIQPEINQSDSPFGDEATGIITAVGNDVTSLKAGMKVMLFYPGTLCSVMRVPANCAVPLPENLDLVSAATIPLAFVTAYYGLHQLAHIKPNQRMLIHSAAGAVGLAAIQLATLMQAQIYATTSNSEKQIYLENFNLEKIYSSRTLDFFESLKKSSTQMDIIINTLTGEFAQKSFELLSPNGIFIDLVNAFNNKNTDERYHRVQMHDLIKNDTQQVKVILEKLAHLYADNKLSVLPYHRFTLEQLPLAINHLANRGHIGKVIIDHNLVLRNGLQTNASYLIVGGLGALGMVLLQWLVTHGAKHIYVADIIQPPANALKTIELLRHAGAHIETGLFDISQASETEKLMSHIKATMPPLKGIINAATLLDDKPLNQQNWPSFSRILACKAQGSWNLHVYSQDLPLEFFILFSSLASLLGSPLQANYASANAFLDGLAHYRQQQGKPALSINWSPWKIGIGAMMGERAVQVMEMVGSHLLDPDKDFTIFEFLLNCTEPQIAVLNIQWNRFVQQYEKTPPLFEYLVSSNTNFIPSQDTQFCKSLATLSGREKTKFIKDYLKHTVASLLEISENEINTDIPFRDLGLDSLLAVNLRNTIQMDVGKELPIMVVFTYPTLSTLATYIQSIVDESADRTTSSDTAQQNEDQALLDDELAGLSELHLAKMLDEIVNENKKNKD